MVGKLYHRSFPSSWSRHCLTATQIIGLVFVLLPIIPTQSFVALRPQQSLSSSFSPSLILSATMTSNDDSSIPKESVSSSSSSSSSSSTPHLVWLTGYSDLRVTDHGGFTAAASSSQSMVVPIFILDPKVHLRQPPVRLSRLLVALRSVERELQERYGIPLIVRTGDASQILPDIASSIGAESCHVVEDDVEDDARSMQRRTCEALIQQLPGKIKIERWNGGLRVGAKWIDDPVSMPDTWEQYSKDTLELKLDLPVDAPAEGKMTPFPDHISSEGIPGSIDDLLLPFQSSKNGVINGDNDDSLEEESTIQPYEELALSLCDGEALREALQTYVDKGRDDFANRYLSDAFGSSRGTNTKSTNNTMKSLHAAAAQRLLDGAPFVDQVLSLREAPVRAFSPGLALGVVSHRQLRAAASSSISSNKSVRPDDVTVFGRSSLAALADTVEWSEFYRRLAGRTLALRERGAPWMAGGLRVTGGDERDRSGKVGFWRWGGQVKIYQFL